MDQNQGIGINNSLPWRLSKDMAFFKKKTTETKDPLKKQAVIMGRLTWESLPASFQPLPNRHNIVVSRQKDYVVPEGVTLIHDLSLLQETLNFLVLDESIESIFLIGGEQLYTWGINQPECKTLYVTRVNSTFPCDAFFPAFDAIYTKVEVSEVHEEKGLSFVFETYRH